MEGSAQEAPAFLVLQEYQAPGKENSKDSPPTTPFTGQATPDVTPGWTRGKMHGKLLNLSVAWCPHS